MIKRNNNKKEMEGKWTSCTWDTTYEVHHGHLIGGTSVKYKSARSALMAINKSKKYSGANCQGYDFQYRIIMDTTNTIRTILN